MLGMSVILRGTLDEQIKCWSYCFDCQLTQDCFDVYDLNSDGYILREEMFVLLKQTIVKVRTYCLFGSSFSSIYP